MKIKSVELKSPNKRDRVAGGIYIEFNSVDRVNKNDFFKITFNDNEYYFNVIDIETIDNYFLNVKAYEVGYWLNKLDRQNIDIRDLINIELNKITDKNKIEEITLQSFWC